MKNSSVDKEKKKEEIIMSSWLQDSASVSEERKETISSRIPSTQS